MKGIAVVVSLLAMLSHTFAYPQYMGFWDPGTEIV